MRLTRRIVDDRKSFRFDGGKDYIDGRTDRFNVKINGICFETVLCKGMNRALVNADGRTERLKTLDMQVDRARYEVTAARECACRHAETTQLRAEDIIRCAD